MIYSSQFIFCRKKKIRTHNSNMPKNKRLRNFCFTWNNYPDDHKERLLALPYKYIVWGQEVAKTGTPHLQGYIELDRRMMFNAIKKKTDPKIHIEERRGTPKEASDYCKKEATVIVEEGKISKQGFRQDLVDIKERILDGELDAVTVLEQAPMLYHQYGRTVEKLQELRNRRVKRNWMTKGVWIYGPTGTGKTHDAMHNYGDGWDHTTHYLWKSDKGWQDDYQGQEVVIINDFRGDIPYNQLLQMVDKYPYSVPRRGKAPQPFLAKTVIITSSLSPDQVYNRRNAADSIKQLLRRFEVIHKTIRYGATAAEGWDYVMGQPA